MTRYYKLVAGQAHAECFEYFKHKCYACWTVWESHHKVDTCPVCEYKSSWQKDS